MSVVRREGKWRLHKQQDGLYEVTYEKQLELKIFTDDYSSSGILDGRDDPTTQSREVASFSEAEQLFEDIVNGNESTGFLDSINLF